MIPAINFNQQPSFQGVKVKGVAIGLPYIEKDMKALQELGKNFNIKITQGTEYITDGVKSVAKPCLNVYVKPLKRSSNIFVRMFNLDEVGDGFELAYRKSRKVKESVISVAERLAEIVKAKNVK